MNIFNFFLQNLPYPIWIEDLDTKIIFLNKAYEEMYNIELANVLGKKNNDVLPNEISKLYADKRESCIKTSSSITIESKINNTYIECLIFPIKDQLGNIIAIGGLSRNINTRKKQ